MEQGNHASAPLHMNLLWRERAGSSLRIKIHCILFFSAIEVVLAFSSLGFIQLQPLSASTMHIPVLLAAIFYGRWAGGAVGAVFGVLSIWKASNASFSPGDAAFSLWLSGNPLGTILTAVGARTIFGFVSGWCYEKLEEREFSWLWMGILTYLLTRLHSFLVFGALGIFFPQLGFSAASTGFVSLTALLSGGLAALIVTGAYYLSRQTLAGRRFLHALMQTEGTVFYRGNLRVLSVFMGVLTIVALALVTNVMSQVETVMQLSGYAIPGDVHRMIFGWGLQFLLAMVAVAFLLFVVFIYFYNMTAIANHRSLLDSLTKLYHKEGVARQINQMLRDAAFDGGGVFIMLDVDHFKSVNDRFGHPKGDEVLCRVAGVLRAVVRDSDIIGRLGGDEFCMYLRGTRDRMDVMHAIERISDGIHKITLPGGAELTSSIGIVLYTGQKTFNEFYWGADKALYASKEKGRNTHSFLDELDG